MRTTYYISNSGNDSNSGTSIAAPWKTLRSYTAGNIYLFQCGGTFYIDVPGLTTTSLANPIDIGSYGTGAKPIISHYTKITNWVNHATNVWKVDLSNTANFTGYTPGSADRGNVGFLKIDGVIWGAKMSALVGLASQWDYYSDGTNTLYVHSSANPSTLATEILVTTGDNGLHVSSYMSVSNIKVMGYGGTGIKGVTKVNVTFTDVDVAEGGGSYLGGGTTRFGAGFSFDEGGTNITVDSCTAFNQYEAGFTMQSHISTSPLFLNCQFINNLADQCESGFNPDILTGGVFGTAGFSLCRVTNNDFRNAGTSWSHTFRPVDNQGTAIYQAGWDTTHNDLIFENNNIFNPLNGVYYLGGTSADPRFISRNNNVCMFPSVLIRKNHAGSSTWTYVLADYAAFTADLGYDVGTLWNTLDSHLLCAPLSYTTGGGGGTISSDTYDPEKHTETNKSIGFSQANPADARTYYYDKTLFKYRPFQNTSEVNSYFVHPENRIGHYSIIINDGTLLSDGTFLGGAIHEYWYKNGVADINLIEKFTVGTVDWTLGYPTYDARYIKSGGAAGGDLNGNYPNPTVRWANGYTTYDGRYLQNLQSVTDVGALTNHTITINKTAGAARDYILRAYMSDAGNNQFFIANSTGVGGQFNPMFGGYIEGSDNGLAFRSLVNPADDVPGTDVSMISMANARTSSATDPNNGTFTAVVNKPLFDVGNLSTLLLRVNANGSFFLNYYANSDPTKFATFDSSGNLILATVSSGGGSPTGSAGGDLGGTYPNPSVTGLMTKALPTLATGLLKYNGSAWVFDTSTYLTANQNITLTGDVTGSGTTSIATTVVWANGYTTYDARYSLNSDFTWSVLDYLNTPASSPVDGDSYLINTAPTGAWVGHANQIATWDADGSTWTFSSASSGDILFDAANSGVYHFNGTIWTLLTTAGTAWKVGGNSGVKNGKFGTTDSNNLNIITNNVARINISSTGGVTISSLAGTGTGFVKASSTGVLSRDTSTYLTGNQSISITGDASGSGATAITLTLATVNSNVGSFGSASKSLSVTANGKGLITAISEQNIQITESQVTNLVTDLSGKQGTLTLTTTGSSGAATLVGNTLNIPSYSGGATSPGGNNTNIQFNNSSAFGGSDNLTWDNTNNILTTSRPSIGTSSLLNGFIVQSSTPSTSSVTAQHSPNFVLRGHGWNSSTLVDNTYDWSFQNQVTGNSSNLTGVLKIDAVNNAGSHVNFISIAGVATTITFNQPTIVNSFLVAPTIQGNVSSGATDITFNNSSKIFAANGRMQIDRNGALQTDRNYMLYVGGEALIFGGTVISQVTAPTLTASYSGAAGSATYKYKVVAILVNGTTTDASPEVTGTSAGVSTLGGNVMLITVVPVRGAYQYKVYRTVAGGTGSSGTTGIIATVNQTATSNSTALFDNGGAGDGTTPPAVNKTGNLGIGTTTPASALDVVSTSQGASPFPRMTSAQRTALTGMQVGWHVYQTDGTEGVYVYKSGGWSFAY